MHISKVELENIKSHARSTFEFTRGTTAITGDNGAGKTTIIEAIAWTLFDLLEYKKDDFVRRGADKGSVRITFESGLDEREYVVFRDTAAAYNVSDPRLNMRIADKKEEVFRFLWQHLGLEPGTDLRSLFRQAIGVPQGTFTAIFLEGATERKVAFDRLLRVEEYRQAAEKLRETSRFLDMSIGAIREDIARAEGVLSRAGAVEAEHKTYAEQTKKLAGQIDAIAKDLAGKQENIRNLDEKERKAASLQSAFEKLKAEKERAELVLTQAEEGVTRAAEAAKKIDDVKPKADRHLEVLGRLKELEREREQRDRLRIETANIEAAIVNIRADQKRLTQDLEAIQKARHEIETLRPMVAEQETVEKDIAVLRDRTAAVRASAAQMKNLDEILERLRESYKANQSQIKTAEEKALMAAELTSLEARTGELMRSLAGLQASLERDERFQREIINGLCPILSQKCLNLKEGETLEAFVSSQFGELRAQIGVFETEQASVTAKLALARTASQAAAALDSLRQRERELADEGKRLRAEKDTLGKQIEAFGDAEERLSHAEARLAALDDPRSRIRFLQKELEREADVRAGISQIESNLERLESDRRILVEQMEVYKDLDSQWTALSGERDETAEAHRIFLANEGEAKTLDDRQKQLETAKGSLADIASKAAALEKELSDATGEYDRESHIAEKALLLGAERRHAETRATFDAAKQREQQLAAELESFAELRKMMQDEFRERERLEKVAETTVFIRDTLKVAAPIVAKNYIRHVSVEANQMFREITGNAERTLTWAEDYSILLEEDGYERPFQTLSGGEQMAAALSVRLALLKQLSDIRIAFFDEPTANLDAERRENLAQQISRITHFDQLFIISHDDTFDSYVDNVIAIG